MGWNHLEQVGTTGNELRATQRNWNKMELAKTSERNTDCSERLIILKKFLPINRVKIFRQDSV